MSLPPKQKYTIRVQTWSVMEMTVEIEARTDREARERALSRNRDAMKGHITKNKTTILSKEPSE